jgi:hypothetical protein
MQGLEPGAMLRRHDDLEYQMTHRCCCWAACTDPTKYAWKHLW